MKIFPATTNSKDAGYTLLEVLVVLVIVSILVASAPAVYARLVPAYQARLFSYDLANQLRVMREQSRSRGQVLVARFSGDQGHIEMPGTVLEVPGGVNVQFNSNPLWQRADADELPFFPTGTTTGGEILVQRENLTVTINIDWISGSIKVIQ